MKTELGNIYCVLAEIRDELHIQNVIEAQRNEIMKEKAYQSVSGSRISRTKIDTELINKLLEKELKEIQ